jgi:hypothetical protein
MHPRFKSATAVEQSRAAYPGQFRNPFNLTWNHAYYLPVAQILSRTIVAANAAGTPRPSGYRTATCFRCQPHQDYLTQVGQHVNFQGLGRVEIEKSVRQESHSNSHRWCSKHGVVQEISRLIPSTPPAAFRTVFRILRPPTYGTLLTRRLKIE